MLNKKFFCQTKLLFLSNKIIFSNRKIDLSQHKMKRANCRIKSMNDKFSLKRINTHCMMAPRIKQIFACKYSFSPIYNWTDTIWWRERRIQLLYSYSALFECFPFVFGVSNDIPLFSVVIKSIRGTLKFAKCVSVIAATVIVVIAANRLKIVCTKKNRVSWWCQTLDTKPNLNNSLFSCKIIAFMCHFH